MKDRLRRVLIVVAALVICAPAGAEAWNRVFPGQACADYQPWIREVEAQGRDVLGPSATRIQTFEPCDVSTRKLSTVIAVLPDTSCADMAGRLSQRLSHSDTIKKLGRLEVVCRGADDHLIVSAPDTYRG